MRELDFIDWIRSQSGFDRRLVPVGPGDDMALVCCGQEKVLVTIDQALDGVHFVLSDCGAQAAGRKAMARSLSDVAAMAAVPQAAVASVALPKGFQRQDAEAIYHGLRQISDEFHCPLVGGDVGSWDGALSISVSIFARSAGIEPILRSGAKADDAICVTGQFGGAWKSKRHLSFQPRITEAVMLAGHCNLHAMIDVSDGLAADLGHICKASGLGAAIVSGDIPIHADARTHCPENPLKAALADGEDYELLFTLPADQSRKLLRDQPLEVPITRIGTMTEGSDVILLHEDGRREELKGYGWEHET